MWTFKRRVLTWHRWPSSLHPDLRIDEYFILRHFFLPEMSRTPCADWPAKSLKGWACIIFLFGNIICGRFPSFIPLHLRALHWCFFNIKNVETVSSKSGLLFAYIPRWSLIYHSFFYLRCIFLVVSFPPIRVNFHYVNRTD